MTPERLEEIKRIYDASSRGLMWDTIRELVAEVERLRKEVHEAETKTLNTYLDKELEIERLQVENEQLKEALQAYYDFSTDEEFAFYPEKTFTERLNDITIKAGEVLKK